MKAILLEQFGIEHLHLRDVPVPAIGDHEVLVKTTAAALEYHDLLVIENRIPFGIPLPHIPISEGVGVVAQIGSKVSRWKKGDRVMVPFITRWEAGKNTPHNNALRTGFSVIDSIFPLEKVQDALHHFKSGKAFGKVVISF